MTWIFAVVSVFCSNRNLPSWSVSTARVFIRTKARGTGAPVFALITSPCTVLGAVAVVDDEAAGELLPNELPVSCALSGASRLRRMTAESSEGSSRPERRRQHTNRAGNTNNTSQGLGR